MFEEKGDGQDNAIHEVEDTKVNQSYYTIEEKEKEKAKKEKEKEWGF